MWGIVLYTLYFIKHHTLLCTGWQKVLKDLQQNPKDRLIYNKTLAFFN